MYLHLYIYTQGEITHYKGAQSSDLHFSKNISVFTNYLLINKYSVEL